MKNLLPVLLSFLLFSNLFGQAVLDNNPSSLKWRQINTEHFRILFPKGFEEQGQRVANTMEKIREPEANTMGDEPRRISIILQNQSSVSNGFVSIIPRRSEFYGMPSQNYNFLGTNDWLNLLMSHEYRHIVQYQHATRGFNRLFYYLFGNATLAGLSQVAAPKWLWEGDAVVTETAFTRSGRGRIPNFGLVFRTNILEGREFNYHKQYLRSYKHNIPNEYPLGFYMVSYLRKRTNDPHIWEKITARSWSVPFLPFAFSNAIKKESGLYVTQLYREMAKDLRAEWKKKLDTLELTPFERIETANRKGYTDYFYPQVMDDGSVIAMKRGIGEIEKFVNIKDGKEKRVFIPGFVNDPGMLSVANDKIVWIEFGYDPRWSVRNYSLVKTYDLKSKSLRILAGKHGRYGSAALSQDGSKVVAIRTSTEYKNQIVILDYKSGAIIKELANPENDYYSMPRWSPDGNQIVVLKTNKAGRSVCLIDPQNEKQTEVVPPSNENIGHPILYGDYLLFNSPVSGIDNIYAINMSTGERFQITNSRHGAYNPSVASDGKTIAYNDQTRDGLDVVKISFDPSGWKRIQSTIEEPQFYKHLVEQEGHPDFLSGVQIKDFPVTKYSKLKGMINPYSWGLNVQTDLTQATIGISSKDILSTTSINLGYVFDINERTGAYKAQVSYQGLFPIIDVSASYSDRSVNEGEIIYYRVFKAGQTKNTVTYKDNLTFNWKEKNVEAGLRIPLTLTNSRYSTNVTFGDYVGYTSVTGFKNSIDDGARLIPADTAQYFFANYQGNGALIYNHFTLTGYRMLKRSRRDIYSKWGQQITLNAYNSPSKGSDYKGEQFSVYGVGYFPGLMKHHSLWGYWGFQSTLIERLSRTGNNILDNNLYYFRNRIPLPRGQSVARFQNFYSMSVNYTMPVWYPDVAVGPLLNIQRLRTNVFMDYGFGISREFKQSKTYASVGAEAKLDINILRFLPQFDIGVRYSKGISPATSKFEVLVGTFNF
jgi:hypothetical protein